MAGFKTGAPELRDAAKRMEDTNQALQGNLAKLGGVISSTQGAWKGEAATSFHTLMERFQTDAKKLNESLNQISESVTGTAQAYEQQEQEAQSSLSKLTQTLGGGA
jgi:WXG100 family type VII secretion target